jgi:histidinol-phosphate phosphatase family protein
MPFSLSDVNKDWTLFLDRDGVINHEKVEDYIYHYGEFTFYKGALEAIKILSQKFPRIILVTNQKGVGKGLMTEDSLQDIHKNMLEEISKAGGRIDSIYYCTALDSNHSHRKPNPGMAFQAKQDFPEIDFSKSLMVGNNISDMEFGRNAGMHTVFVKTTSPDQTLPHSAIDLAFNDLLDFAKAL